VFTTAAVLTLALGIGANATIFSAVRAVLLRPLPFPQSDQLTVIYEQNASQGETANEAAAETFRDWREQTSAFADLAYWTYWGLALTGAGEPQEITVVRASASLFSVLGVSPALGRSFTQAEETIGRDRVVVLSHALWSHDFGADPGIVGRDVTLDGEPYRVIGVMPAGFRFPDSDGVGMWAPLALKPFELRSRSQRMFDVIGRLRDGFTLGQAQAELDGISKRLAAAYPATNAGWNALAVPANDLIAGSTRTPLLILFGAVGFVLLIACANVSNLLLARAASREQEIAIRIALGAARPRLIRQLLVESVLIATLGGALGVCVALWGIDLLRDLYSGNLPGWNPVRMDGAVLGFSVGLSLLTVLLAGLAPALHAAKPNLDAALRGAGGRSVAGGRRRIRQALVVLEVALSLMLLAGAGLLLKSFVRVREMDPGFAPQGLLSVSLYLPDTRYPDDKEQTAFFAALVDRVRNIPGVLSAGAVTTLPMNEVGIDHDIGVEVLGRPVAEGKSPRADFRIATPGYFETMEIPLIKGRVLGDQDREDAPRVAIVNQVFSDRLLPGEDPIGKRVRFGGSRGDVEIVGVIGPVRHHGLDAEPRPEIYVPFRQLQYGGMTVVARTTGDPLQLAAPIKSEIFALDPGLPVARIATVTSLLSGSVAARRFNLLLLEGFATLALILAAVGIYGVISYNVSQRTRETGIRIALGARTTDVIGGVLRDGLGMTALGLAAGLLGAVALSRVLRGLLFEVTPGDPVALAGAAGLLLAVALVACTIPARRATRVDPIIALRSE
jgi:predicted permease